MEYQEIEDLFGLLFESISGQLPEMDLAQARMFFEAGEYGIALETLVETLGENFIQKNPSAASLIERLKRIMEI
jgi:hypothetical protein